MPAQTLTALIGAGRLVRICSDYYAPECDGSVRWDSVGIDWGTDAPVLSDKDAQAVAFDQFETPFQYEG
ncbi:dTDP-4-dehydrorhamnose 3,5-epimerase family protein [Roseinatronobacter sp.]